MISVFGRLGAGDGGAVTARRWSFHLVTASGPLAAAAVPAHKEIRKSAIPRDRNGDIQCRFITRSSMNAVVSDAAEEIHQRRQIRRAEQGECITRRRGLPAMRTNRLLDAVRAPVVQEMRAVGHAPERRRSELATSRRS